MSGEIRTTTTAAVVTVATGHCCFLLSGSLTASLALISAGAGVRSPMRTKAAATSVSPPT